MVRICVALSCVGFRCGTVTDSSVSVDTGEQLKRYDLGSFAAVGTVGKYGFFGDFGWGWVWIGEVGG